jgi:CelD/BcsL family acetyltransferase involved in cellulose biosynthesis
MMQGAPSGAALVVACAPFPGWDALAAEWRRLEATAASPAFFQGWTWVGCLAPERFRRPLLVRASAGGRTLGLALFNRHRGRLLLTETGDPDCDSVYVEHNAPLLAADAPAETLGRMLRAAWDAGALGMQLSGVPQAVAAAANGVVWRRRVDVAPWRDLDRVRAVGGDALADLSANTRQQIRRAMRRAEVDGALRLDRAPDTATAQAWLDALGGLHAVRWERDGRPGAFASPWVRRFHAELLTRGVPRGEVDLLRLTAGDRALGYLYNFRLGGRVLAYQSGLVEAASAQDKPGLLAHCLAIRAAAADGMTAYDFLAGDVRYKRSLADGETMLTWASLLPPPRPRVLVLALRAAISR